MCKKKFPRLTNSKRSGLKVRSGYDKHIISQSNFCYHDRKYERRKTLTQLLAQTTLNMSTYINILLKIK